AVLESYTIDTQSHISCGPYDLPCLHAVDVLHSPVELDQMPAVVAHDPLPQAGRTGRVQDVQRIGGRHRDTVRWLRLRHQLRPLDVAPRDHRRSLLRSLENDAAIRFGRGEFDRLVEEWLVRH